MAGLVWIDRLDLTWPQWIALLASMAALVRYGVTWRVLLCVHAAMITACWNTPLSTDTRLLCESAGYLQRYTWPQFLSEFAFRDYVKLQPPFYTFWFSRLPVLWLHQFQQAAVLVPCGLLMRDMFGPDARLLLSTPVYLLMSAQPGNDVALFVALLCVVRLHQQRRPLPSAVLYGAAFLVKPLMLVTVPVMVPRLKGWIVVSGALIACYYAWSIRFHFGIEQWNFLASQLLLERFSGLLRGAGGI